MMLVTDKERLLDLPSYQVSCRKEKDLSKCLHFIHYIIGSTSSLCPF